GNISGARSQEDVFKASFTAWQSANSILSFTEGAITNKQPGFDGLNVITTSVPSNQYPAVALGLTYVFSFPPGSGVDEYGRPIDFAGQIVEADIMFNPSAAFSTDVVTPSNKIDLQSIATHEIGHFLGLDHSTILSATMFPTLTSGASYARALSTDDVAGISTIYPQPSFANK